jgi:Tol biopolymer transport system component
VRDTLERVPLPDADAAQVRAWAAVADAYDARTRAPRRGHRRAPVLAIALATALVAAAVAVAAEPPRWVRHALGEHHATVTPRAQLGPLPPGRLLVSSRNGTWIVQRDGTRRRLGPWTGATWSPGGLYVAAWRGRSLNAVAPDGRVAWTWRAFGTVRDAVWSPDGYRIAYRRDDVLAVIAGDGTGARVFARPIAPVAPAWRPGAPHTLAWVGADGRVEVRDVDTGALMWRSATRVPGARALAWSADGHRLIARGAARVVVFDLEGKRAWRVRLPRGARVSAAAWAPRADRIALTVRVAGATGVYVTRSGRVPQRPIFTTSGRLRSLAWSPDGRRLLVRWSEADQWLLLSPAAPRRITAIGAIARRFGPAPAVEGWLRNPA